MACGYFFDGCQEQDAVEHGEYRNTKRFSKLATRYMKPHILAMTSEDRPYILKIAESLTQHFAQKGLALIETDLESQKGFVHRMNDKIVGFVSYFSNQAVAEISWMGVHPELQRQHIETELLEHLKQVAKKNGAHLSSRER